MNFHNHSRFPQQTSQPQHYYPQNPPSDPSTQPFSELKLKKRPNTALVMKQFYIPGERPKSSMQQHKLLEWRCECGEQIYVNKLMGLDLADNSALQRFPGKKIHSSRERLIKEMKGNDEQSQMRFREMSAGIRMSPYDILMEKYSTLKSQEVQQQEMHQMQLESLEQHNNNMSKQNINNENLNNYQNNNLEGSNMLAQTYQQQQQQNHNNEVLGFQEAVEEEEDVLDIMDDRKDNNSQQDNSIELHQDNNIHNNNNNISLDKDNLSHNSKHSSRDQKSEQLTYEQLLLQNRSHQADSLLDEQHNQQLQQQQLPASQLNNPQNGTNNYMLDVNNLGSASNRGYSFNSLNNISVLSGAKRPMKQRPQTGNLARTVNLQLENNSNNLMANNNNNIGAMNNFQQQHRQVSSAVQSRQIYSAAQGRQGGSQKYQSYQQNNGNGGSNSGKFFSRNGVSSAKNSDKYFLSNIEDINNNNNDGAGEDTDTTNSQVAYFANKLFQPSSQIIKNSSFYSLQQHRRQSQQTQQPIVSQVAAVHQAKSHPQGPPAMKTILLSPLIQDNAKQSTPNNNSRQNQWKQATTINTQTDEGKQTDRQSGGMGANFLAQSHHSFKVSNLFVSSGSLPNRNQH